jgi:glycine/D-amino acid oxidase-like deaminating enzyme
MTRSIGRRQFLTAAAAVSLSGALTACTRGPPNGERGSASVPALQLQRLRASADRITNITVCTRPFRPQGPRLDVERLAGKTVVHNYGHGGSGWSLSWGSSAIAIQKALATGDREFAVVGCGAMGLTSAILLQRAGARVTIYTKDLPPNAPSSKATGLWTPDSRICLDEHATPEFRQLWENMARRSFTTYQSFLGLPGTPVEFIDFYLASDGPDAPRRGTADARPKFADLQQELIGDLVPHSEQFAPGQHPLGPHYLRGSPLLMFNLSSYTRTLIADFRAAGGQIEIVEFHAPADLARIREKTLVNATGYGARALFDDQSIVPVRGQVARAVPQPQINYGLIYRDTAFVPRRDGFVFQVIGENDYYGFNDDSAAPDRAEAEHAVATIAGLFSSGNTQP